MTFKKGDTVRVNNPSLKSHGYPGVIDFMWADGKVSVRFPDIPMKQMSVKSLVLEESKNPQPKAQKYLAYIYSHDAENNPCPDDIVNGSRFCRDWELDMPSGVVYGTPDEIRDKCLSIMKDNLHANCFVVIEGRIHPIEFTAYIKGID